MALIVLEDRDQRLPPVGRDVRVLRELPDARDQPGVAFGVERDRARPPGTIDQRVPLADHGVPSGAPVRLRGRRCQVVGRFPRRLGARLGVVLVDRRRDGSEPVGRYEGRRVGGLPAHGPHVLLCLRRGRLPFGLPPCAMRLPHGRGAAMALGAVVEMLEFFDSAAPDAGALGQQRSEGLGARPEGLRLLEQRRVAVQGLAIGIAQRHRIAIRARPLAQLVPRRHHLLPAGGEGVDGCTVAPGESRPLHITRDARQRVVVRS